MIGVGVREDHELDGFIPRALELAPDNLQRKAFGTSLDGSTSVDQDPALMGESKRDPLSLPRSSDEQMKEAAVERFELT
jgi:hypothetical protein